jgi:phosphoribosyl 1,2-cyclic phosphodiesterase
MAGFTVKPFKVNHDAAEPVGYLIHHNECGNVLFLTDTMYCSYTFASLNNIIIEANYSQEILDERLRSGASPDFLRNRVLQSHMSLNTCKDLLRANDLRSVNNIVLIHLSDSNSDAKQFHKEVSELTGKNVFVAEPGLTIPFNKTPF